jgi:hypothetical protein
MRRLLLVAATAIGLVASSPSPWAGAGPASSGGPPRLAVVYRHGVIQRASPYTFCWNYDSGGGTGYGLCADGTRGYPSAVSVHAPTRVAIRIRSTDRPRRWFMSAAPRVRHHSYWDEPIGSTKLPFRLVPHRVQGQITGWDAIVRLTEPDRDYYIDAGGYFPRGDAWYTLHLHT